MRRARKTVTDQVIDVAENTGRGLSAPGAERRQQKRHGYDALVAIVLLEPGELGKTRAPLVVRAKDLSTTGIRVITRHMIHPNAVGAMQLMRSDGTLAIVGITARHCRYAGDMMHETGFEFTALPPDLPSSRFLDRNGRMVLLDAMLEQNRK